MRYVLPKEAYPRTVSTCTSNFMINQSLKFSLSLFRREEADGVHNSLAIVENIVEFRPAVCREAAQAGLLAWLVKKLKVKVPFDANKLYASEILSILLQNEPENRWVGCLFFLFLKDGEFSFSGEIDMHDKLCHCPLSVFIVSLPDTKARVAFSVHDACHLYGLVIT